MGGRSECVCVGGGENSWQKTDWILRKITFPKTKKNLEKNQKKNGFFKNNFSFCIPSTLSGFYWIYVLYCMYGCQWWRVNTVSTWMNTVRHPCISIPKVTKQKFAELFQTLWISSAAIEWNQLLNKQEISLPPLLEHSQPSLFKEPCCRRVPLHHFGCSHTHTHTLYTGGESHFYVHLFRAMCARHTLCWRVNKALSG